MILNINIHIENILGLVESLYWQPDMDYIAFDYFPFFSNDLLCFFWEEKRPHCTLEFAIQPGNLAHGKEWKQNVFEMHFPSTKAAKPRIQKFQKGRLKVACNFL